MKVMNKMVCFADNLTDIKTAFKDYMFHYYTEVGKKSGYVYDKGIEFSVKEEKVNRLMKKEIAKISGINMENTDISPEMYAQNPMYRWATFAVINSLIDMVLPETIDRNIGIYSDTRYGGPGDSFLWTVEPNDLFFVSKAGYDQRTVEFQKQYEGQVSVIPEPRAITVDVNLYKVLCGLESLARFVMKAIISMETQLSREVWVAFNTAMSAIPATPAGSALRVTGWSDTEAIRVAQTVTAFNNGSRAVFVGTPLALRHMLPSDANYRYDLESPYVTVGYLRNVFTYDVMVLDQIADWENPYSLVLDDERIYVISPAQQKPIKIAFEGNTVSNSNDAFQSASLTETTTIRRSWGIAVATNAVAGLITL